jgi:hypothetical protein
MRLCRSQLREKYEKKEWAKRAMMRHLFRNDDTFNEADYDDDDELVPG